VYSTDLFAGTPVAQQSELLSSAHDPLSMSSLWQLTLGMILVLGLIVAIAWLLKRSGRFQAAAGGGLRILGGLSMGSRERVVLLQVGSTQLLVGVAPGRVQTLHVLGQPVQNTLQAPDATGRSFGEQLGKFINRESAG
jgi:flagellar protein FliO/FliZ